MTLFGWVSQRRALVVLGTLALALAGAVVASRLPSGIYPEVEFPRNVVVAAFVGHPIISLLKCRIDDGALTLEGTNQRLPVEGPLLETVRKAPKAQVILGLRSEDVTVSDESSSGALPAEVYAVEPLGDRCIYDLQIGGVLLRARTDPDYMRKQGDRVWIRYDAARAHLFDAVTEERIA